MALTLLEPNSLNFAGNPIVLKATTDKSLSTDESMLRIVCSIHFEKVGESSMQFSDELSQSVENSGTAVFNLSDIASTIIKRIHAEMDMNSGSAFNDIGLQGIAVCKEVWVKDGAEKEGDSVSSSVISVVPGAFTDFELIVKNDIDLVGITSSEPQRMTRKPDPGIIYKGETVILPMLSYSESRGTYYVSVNSDIVNEGSYVIKGSCLDYVLSTVNAGFEGDLLVHLSKVGPWTGGYYRTNTSDVHFLRFINGFGAVENISVRSKSKLSYEVSGDTHSLVQGISVRPSDRRYATKSQPVGVYELSSGYVPKRWAEWYVQELLTSPRVWIQVGEKWIPALIEAEDDCVIYDRSKPEMPHVDFTLRLAIDGVTGVVW